MDVSEITTPDGWYATRPWIDRDDADIDAVGSDESLGLFDPKAALRTWRRDGVVLFENAVPRDLIDELGSDLEHICSHPEAYPITLDVDGKMCDIRELAPEALRRRSRLKFYALLQFSAAARRLSLNPTVTAFLRCVFRQRPSPMSSLTFMRGSEQPPHIDYAYVYRQRALPMMAAAWLPLADVTADSGPLAYYPGSHKVEEVGFFPFDSGRQGEQSIFCTDPREEVLGAYTTWLEGRMEALGYEKKIFLPKAGDVLIWHAALVHGGTPITNPDSLRRSHVTHYTGEHLVPADQIKRDASGRPIYFEHGSGVAFQFPWLDGDFG